MSILINVSDPHRKFSFLVRQLCETIMTALAIDVANTSYDNLLRRMTIANQTTLGVIPDEAKSKEWLYGSLDDLQADDEPVRLGNEAPYSFETQSALSAWLQVYGNASDYYADSPEIFIFFHQAVHRIPFIIQWYEARKDLRAGRIEDAYENAITAIPRLIPKSTSKMSLQKAAIPQGIGDEPKAPSRPVSLTCAAKWFGMDRRTLEASIDNHITKATKISPRRWIFDLDQINEIHHKEADPEKYRA